MPKSLIKNGDIEVAQNNKDNVTFHDPCNLSRMMGEPDAPRTSIKSACSNFSELKNITKINKKARLIIR